MTHTIYPLNACHPFRCDTGIRSVSIHNINRRLNVNYNNKHAQTTADCSDECSLFLMLDGGILHIPQGLLDKLLWQL